MIRRLVVCVLLLVACWWLVTMFAECRSYGHSVLYCIQALD